MERYLPTAAMLVTMIIVSFLTMEIPGGPTTWANRNRTKPKTRADLWNEYGNRLSDAVYDAFARGVDYHLKGDLDSAAKVYSALGRVRLPDGSPFDLAGHSKTIQHNIRLIDSQLRR
jgi:hypothetical protein